MSDANHFLKSILVVDDEPLILELLKAILLARGYAVELANRASNALAMMARQSFDLIITDYQMPGLRGDDFARIVRHRNPNQRILLLTGAGDNLGAPVDVVVKKPFRTQELLDRIRRLLCASHRLTQLESWMGLGFGLPEASILRMTLHQHRGPQP